MSEDKQGNHESRISGFISMGKDIISFFRDGALLLLAIMLVIFPVRFNDILRSAGFKEGSIAGMKWESSLIDSNEALKETKTKMSDLENENRELLKTLSEAKVFLDDSKLKQRINNLEKNNIAQQQSTVIVQKSVEQTITANENLFEKTQSLRNKSDYVIGLQTLGIADSERKYLNEQLHSTGYTLDTKTYSYSAEERPSWFAFRSTVFYYSASALPAAQELAREMNTLTKQNFAVQRGNGLGVDPSHRDVTLFVHMVKG
jgi:hypothetical protein